LKISPPISIGVWYSKPVKTGYGGHTQRVSTRFLYQTPIEIGGPTKKLKNSFLKKSS